MSRYDRHIPLTPTEAIERTARRRAGAKLGWYVHAVLYVVVNIVIFAMSKYAFGDRPWSVFPLLGWGLGLAIHGVVVFFVTGGGGLYERLLQRERNRLTLQRDPW